MSETYENIQLTLKYQKYVKCSINCNKSYVIEGDLVNAVTNVLYNKRIVKCFSPFFLEAHLIFFVNRYRKNVGLVKINLPFQKYFSCKKRHDFHPAEGAHAPGPQLLLKGWRGEKSCALVIGHYGHSQKYSYEVTMHFKSTEIVHALHFVETTSKNLWFFSISLFISYKLIKFFFWNTSFVLIVPGFTRKCNDWNLIYI